MCKQVRKWKNTFIEKRAILDFRVIFIDFEPSLKSSNQIQKMYFKIGVGTKRTLALGCATSLSDAMKND